MERHGGSNDGGIDLLSHDRRRAIATECKRWPSAPLGRPLVQKLNLVAPAERAISGFVMTSRRFTGDAGRRDLHCMDSENRPMPYNKIAILAEGAWMRLTPDAEGPVRPGAASALLAGPAALPMGRRLPGGDGGR